IYIEPNEEKCIGAVLTKNINDFNETFSSIKKSFQDALAIPSDLSSMPKKTINNIPTAPSKWTLNDADTSNRWETSSDPVSSKVNGHYTRNINFTQYVNVNDSGGTVFDHSLSVQGGVGISVPTEIHGDAYINGSFSINKNTIVYGNLYVQGSIDVNANLDVRGNVYTNSAFNINNNTSIGTTSSTDSIDTGNVYVNGSLNINNSAKTLINGNVYSEQAFNINGSTDIGPLNQSITPTVKREIYVRGSFNIKQNSPTNIFGNVYTAQALNVDSNTIINGNAYTAGALTISKPFNVKGNTYSADAITISAPVTFGYKDDKLLPHDGYVYSGGALTINSPTTFNGNLYLDKNWTALNFDARCLVEGNVYSGGYLGITKSTIFNVYVYSIGYDNSMNIQYNGNEPAPQFNRTVYIENSTYVNQQKVTANDGPKILEFKQGAVIKNTAGYSTTGDGEIYFGLQQHGGDNSGGSGESSGNSGQSPITIVDTKTNYQ
ncbi:MAG: hypothetical protein ABF629_02680, partial [Sporolactobacillus sp.]